MTEISVRPALVPLSKRDLVFAVFGVSRKTLYRWGVPIRQGNVVLVDEVVEYLKLAKPLKGGDNNGGEDNDE